MLKFKIGTKTVKPTKVIGVGMNYSAHIKEMNSARPKEPVLFLKPSTALCNIEPAIDVPRGFGAVHHEVELAVMIGREAKNVSLAQAAKFIAGYGLALDLTLRDLQKKAKQAGHPWAICKGFDNSCPLSQFVPAEDIPEAHNLDISLRLNGELRQNSNTKNMIFKIEELISYCSHFFTLYPGDIIITGTPSGVGPLAVGDKIEARIDGVADVKTICE